MTPDYWLVPDTLVKEASETRRFNMEFAARLADDEEIAQLDSYSAAKDSAEDGVDLDEAEDLSISPAFSGTQVQFQISGGTEGVIYKITANITGDLSTVAEGTGYLFVN